MCYQSSEVVKTFISIASSQAKVDPIIIKFYPQIRMVATFCGWELVTFRTPRQ